MHKSPTMIVLSQEKANISHTLWAYSHVKFENRRLIDKKGHILLLQDSQDSHGYYQSATDKYNSIAKKSQDRHTLKVNLDRVRSQKK